jgi:hypothetical protein
MDTTEDMLGGGSYNKDTYIGHLKMKRGGMKVIPGEIDDHILAKRDNLLDKLGDVIYGGDDLQEKNLERYFKALGGKYIRNDMCLSGDKSSCKKAKKLSIGGAMRLMEIGAKKISPNVLDQTFKGAAPVLYEKYKNNITKNINRGNNMVDHNPNIGNQPVNYNPGNNMVDNRMNNNVGGHNAIDYNTVEPNYNRGGYDPRGPGNYNPYYNNMQGGSINNLSETSQTNLENFRLDIGRYQYFSGGSNEGVYYTDIELNKLRDEIDLIR